MRVVTPLLLAPGTWPIRSVHFLLAWDELWYQHRADQVLLVLAALALAVADFLVVVSVVGEGGAGKDYEGTPAVSLHHFLSLNCFAQPGARETRGFAKFFSIFMVFSSLLLFP
jgi:hypothetical protein